MNKAEQLVKLLIEKKYTVSFAESCTGGKMAARIAYDINQNTSSKAIAAMSDDNQETINEYKDKLCIIKTPKKGGIGLNESLEGMCVLAKALYQEKEIEEIKEKFCF